MLLFLLLAAVLAFFEIRTLRRESRPARAYAVYAVLMAAALALALVFFLAPAFTLTGWLPPLDPPYGT